MTIKFYPSRLPGEPLETHEHGVLTLHEWMSRNVPSYSQDKTHPVVIELNGQAVPPAERPPVELPCLGAQFHQLIIQCFFTAFNPLCIRIQETEDFNL